MVPACPANAELAVINPSVAISNSEAIFLPEVDMWFSQKKMQKCVRYGRQPILNDYVFGVPRQLCYRMNQ